MLDAIDLGGKAISEADLLAQEEALAATRTEIDKEESRALSARERQELGFQKAQEQLANMQAKVSARQDADEAIVAVANGSGGLGGIELPSYLESGLSESQIQGDHLAEARVVAFEAGPLGMGLAFNDSFEGSDSLLDKYSTLVERLNPLTDGSAGAAEATGAVFVSDLVVLVNGLDVSEKDHGQVIAHVRASARPVEIGFLSPHQLDRSLPMPHKGGSPEEGVSNGPGFIQLVAEELAWDLLEPLSAKETIDRACSELGIDTENNSMHEAADLVAQQLGIPGLTDNRSMNSTLSSVHESPEEEVESPSPRDGDSDDTASPDPRAKAKARALARARARQEASRPLTDDEASQVLVDEQKRRTDWLRQVPLFRPIKSKKAFMEDLARKLEVRTVRKGTLIIEKGDETATEMYFHRTRHRRGAE